MLQKPSKNYRDCTEPVSPISPLFSSQGLQLPCQLRRCNHTCILLTQGIQTQDVTLAALYVSTKMHDTLKKPQDLLMVSYAIRFPDLAAKSKAIGGDVTMDPEVNIPLPYVYADQLISLSV